MLQFQKATRFADIEIHPARRQVLRNGEPLALGARAFDLLLALAAAPGRVLSKDDLLDAVWGGAAIGENNLVVQIGALRKALGPGCITTLPGRGYQWTGGDPLDAPPDAPAAADPRPPAPAAAPGGALVGREHELAALHQALARRPPSGVLSIVGPAGIGKTALARTLAAQVTLARPGAPACSVELATLPPQADPSGGEASDADTHTDTVATAIAAALGARPAAHGGPLAALLQHLAQRAAAGTLPALLLLDNCEHVHAAARAVVAAVTASVPALPVLVTSQLPQHHPRETVLRVPPLAVPEHADLPDAAASGAVALFCLRAAAVDPRFVPDQARLPCVIDICRRLDGVPLALELAAGRVALLGVEGVRSRLDERLRLLRSSRDAPQTRHRTLEAALDWTHRLLHPGEQRLLRRLSVFVGGITASAAQAVAQDVAGTPPAEADATPGQRLDPWAVLDALGTLVERSLVTVQPPAAAPAGGDGEPRLMLLETVRAYAVDRLRASGEFMTLGRRHAEHFLALAQAHGGGLLGGSGAPDRRARVAAELDNLRAAMAWCIEHDIHLGLRLAAALGLLWRELGLLSEGRRACAELLRRTPNDPPGPTRMAVQVALGAMAMEQDDAAQMQEMGELVLQASRACADRRREAHAHGLLAHAAAARNDIAQACAHFGQCLVIYRGMDEARTIAETLNNLAQCHLADGRCDQALALLHEALPLARASGHAWTEAAVLQTTGDVHLALDDLQAAAPPLAASLHQRRRNGHAQQVVMSLQSLALLALRRGQPDAARPLLQEAASACALNGYGRQLDGLSLLGTGAWSVAVGRPAQAQPLLAVARALLQGTPVGNRPHVQRALDAACRASGPGPDDATAPAPGAALSQAIALLRA